jgi:ankyrin repeat protein
MRRRLPGIEVVLLVALACGPAGALRAQPSHEGRDGLTPLMRTAAWTQYDVLAGQEEQAAGEAERLLQAGAAIDARDRTGRTALMWAAGWHHPEVVGVLLRHHADVNARDKRGRTALTWAAQGESDIVDALVRHGARESVTDALLLGHERQALERIRAGEPFTVPGPEAQTVLMIASANGYLPVVEALLRRHADVNARDESGRTALMSAVGPPPRQSQLGTREPVEDPAAAARPALIRLLKAHGARSELRDAEDGDTALIRAADYGTVAVVQALLAAGVSVNARSRKHGDIALSRAIARGRTTITAALLVAGADPNQGDRYRRRPLHEAAGRSPEAVRQLLDHGAQVDARDSTGQTPLIVAVGAPVLRVLLAAGADPNARSKAGASALTWAAARRDTEAVRLLQEAHARVELLDALYLGDRAAAHALIQAGARWEANGPAHATALIVAAEQGMSDVVEALLARPVNVNARDDYGRTALMWAAERGDAPAVQALLRRGADPRLRERLFDWRTALAIAEAARQPQVVELLKSADGPHP